jgi:hypothetical protein
MFNKPMGQPNFGFQPRNGLVTPTEDDETEAEAEGEAPAAEEGDYWTNAQSAFQGIMADDAQAWQDQQGALQGEMAEFMRRADSINARMGGGIGGGSAGLAGAAMGEGMKAYNAAAMEYGNRRRATQLAWLDQQIEHGQRQEERDWSEEDRDYASEEQLMQMYLEYGADVPWEDFLQDMRAAGIGIPGEPAPGPDGEAPEGGEYPFGQTANGPAGDIIGAGEGGDSSGYGNSALVRGLNGETLESGYDDADQLKWAANDAWEMSGGDGNAPKEFRQCWAIAAAEAYSANPPKKAGDDYWAGADGSDRDVVERAWEIYNQMYPNED